MSGSKLRVTMWIGGVYDAVLGLSVILALEPLSRILPVPFPAEPFYARMQGVVLCGLAAFYLFAAHDLEKNLRNVAGAIFIRGAGGLYLAGYAATGKIAPFFHVFAWVDVGFAALHLWFLRSERGVKFWPLFLRGVG